MIEQTGLQTLIDTVTELGKRIEALEARGGRGGSKSIWEIIQVIEAKEKLITQLRHAHCSEVAMGDQWDSPDHKAQYLKLRKGIKELTAQLAGM